MKKYSDNSHIFTIKRLYARRAPSKASLRNPSTVEKSVAFRSGVAQRDLWPQPNTHRRAGACPGQGRRQRRPYITRNILAKKTRFYGIAMQGR